jgi:hypothetical protein
MFNPSISPIIAISAWRNKANSISVLCGIQNDNPINLFTDNSSEWSKTCIQVFGEKKFADVFGMDASTISGDKDSPVQLGVNLSELVNRNFSIQVIETTSLAEAMSLGVVGKDASGKPVIYESNYKKDRKGARILNNGQAIYRKSFLRAHSAKMEDIIVKNVTANLDAIQENVATPVAVEAEQD